MNSSQTDQSKQAGLLKKITGAMGIGKVKDHQLEVNIPPDDRGNRLCVSVSIGGIHLTDGTVGFQNLNNNTWDAFYDTIKQRCIRYDINELVLVLDGDIVDMIRSSKWVQAKIYPWERERTAEFSAVVNDIFKDIVEIKHPFFFNWLKTLESKLKQEVATNEFEVIIIALLGNFAIKRH